MYIILFYFITITFIYLFIYYYYYYYYYYILFYFYFSFLSPLSSLPTPQSLLFSPPILLTTDHHPISHWFFIFPPILPSFFLSILPPFPSPSLIISPFFHLTHSSLSPPIPFGPAPLPIFFPLTLQGFPHDVPLYFHSSPHFLLTLHGFLHGRPLIFFSFLLHFFCSPSSSSAHCHTPPIFPSFYLFFFFISRETHLIIHGWLVVAGELPPTTPFPAVGDHFPFHPFFPTIDYYYYYYYYYILNFS